MTTVIFSCRLNRVGVSAGLAEGPQNLRQVLFLGIRVAERVGHVKPRRGHRARVAEERLQLREET